MKIKFNKIEKNLFSYWSKEVPNIMNNMNCGLSVISPALPNQTFNPIVLISNYKNLYLPINWLFNNEYTKEQIRDSLFGFFYLDKVEGICQDYVNEVKLGKHNSDNIGIVMAKCFELNYNTYYKDIYDMCSRHKLRINVYNYIMFFNLLTNSYNLDKTNRNYFILNI